MGVLVLSNPVFHAHITVGGGHAVGVGRSCTINSSALRVSERDQRFDLRRLTCVEQVCPIHKLLKLLPVSRSRSDHPARVVSIVPHQDTAIVADITSLPFQHHRLCNAL